MSLVSEAYNGLFPEKEFEYDAKIKYSNKFNDYNANVRYRGNYLEFGLSKKWKEIGREIRIGLIQSLMAKIFKTKKTTTNIDLYNIFLKNVHIAAPKYLTDPMLQESFDRLNDEYFYGLMDRPNLTWAKSINKLGSYEYGSDTITISKILENKDELLDYVMYHEMLHKKHKFTHNKGRSLHHSKKFRTDEKSYPASELLERELKKLVTKNKIKKAFGFGF
ncbi:hypothetical protein HQ529_05765 [Candidatus Woesearchaeota archaeon]|nr:hypothetical protein [Candidatus Woesearchaeota archaeon]